MPVSAGLSGNRKETATGADGGGERSKHRSPSTPHPGLQALGQPISSPPPRGSKRGNAHPPAAPGVPPGSAKRVWGLVAASGGMHAPAASSALCRRSCLVSPPLPQTPACPLGPSPLRTGARKPGQKAPTPPPAAQSTHPAVGGCRDPARLRLQEGAHRGHPATSSVGPSGGRWAPRCLPVTRRVLAAEAGRAFSPKEPWGQEKATSLHAPEPGLVGQYTTSRAGIAFNPRNSKKDTNQCGGATRMFVLFVAVALGINVKDKTSKRIFAVILPMSTRAGAIATLYPYATSLQRRTSGDEERATVAKPLDTKK